VEHTWRLPDMGYYMLDNNSAILLWEAHRCSPATREVAFNIAKEYAKEYNIRKVSNYSKGERGKEGEKEFNDLLIIHYRRRSAWRFLATNSNAKSFRANQVSPPQDEGLLFGLRNAIKIILVLFIYFYFHIVLFNIYFI
jgi:hypothetical protein